MQVVLKCGACKPWVLVVVHWGNAGGEGHLDGEFPGVIVYPDWFFCE